jgi:hypothetical protein
MVILTVNGISVFLAAIVVAIAIKKWHIIRDRQQILSVIKNALKERKALLSGILMAVFYLAVFMILGGKGGRIHILFGRLIWNTEPGEVLTGLLLAMLVMVSISLFVFGVRLMGAKQSGKKSRAGFFGSLLALLVAFCP